MDSSVQPSLWSWLFVICVWFARSLIVQTLPFHSAFCKSFKNSPTGSMSDSEEPINPFQATITFLKTKVLFEYSNSTKKIINFHIIWRLLTLLSCVAIILIPIFKGKSSRIKHLWLVRRRIPHAGQNEAYSESYLVPNRCLMIAICELASGFMFIVLPFTNSMWFRRAIYGRVHVISVWYEIAWLPTYVGIWAAGWGLCYACICNCESKTTKRWLRHLSPFVFNAVLLSWPLIVIALTTTWAALSVVAGTEAYDTLFGMIMLLESASTAWESKPNDPSTSMHVKEVVSQKELVIRALHRAEQLTRESAAVWILNVSILALFYMMISLYFFRLMKQLLRFCYKQALSENGKQFQSTSSNAHLQNIFGKSSVIMEEVRTEFRFLALHSILISLVVLSKVSAFVLQYLSTYHLTSAIWRESALICSLLPSTFISMALWLQCLRILTERIVADEIQSTPMATPKHTQLVFFPAQHLRLSVTENIYASGSKDAFPGVCEVPESPESDHWSPHDRPCSSSTGKSKICISREVEVFYS